MSDLELVDPAQAWDLSCPDWEQRMREGRSLLPAVPLWEDAADRGVRSFNKLRLADVPNTPLLADAAGEWFRDIVRAVFGSFNRETRRRMIREVFCLVPKKNSKTSYGALLMLVALLLNQRPKASFLMTAPVIDTANLAFDQCDGAISLDPVLKSLLHVKSHLKTIEHRMTGATLEIVTFDPSVATGRKASGGLLIDELHVVAKMGAKAASVIRQLRGGMLPFPEAFLIITTTQSEEQPVGVMDAELTVARNIRDGIAKGRMLPILYELPMRLQAQPENGAPPAWKNPELWPMVMPNLGRSIQLEDLKEGLEEAEQKGAAEVQAWASQHLNVQVGVGLHATSWTAAQYWQACADTRFSGGMAGLKTMLDLCDVAVAGIDGGGLDDLLALVITGRHSRTKEWLVWAHCWANRKVLSIRKSEAASLLDFEADGDLTFVDVSGPDIVQLVDCIELCETEGLLDRIGVDQAGISTIVDEIAARKIDRERVIGIPQGWKMVGAIKTTERQIESKRLRHAGQRLMAYAMGNAKVEPRGNAVIITKETAGKAKIDPVLAMLDACTLMGLDPKPRRKLFQLFTVGG